MSKIDGSGSAFPHPEFDQNGMRLPPGLTKRDWFAGQAINGLLANGKGFNSPWMDHLPSAAEWAYRVADAMLAERDK